MAIIKKDLKDSIIESICERYNLNVPKNLNGIVSVSNSLTAKMKGMYVISTSPLCNSFCKAMHEKDNTVCKKCFAFKLRPESKNAYAYNSYLLSEYDLSDHPELLPVFPPGSFVRFNAHGELMNVTHLINLLAIVRQNPFVNFALWTKRDALVIRHLKFNGGWDAIPDNLQLIYSEPALNVCNKDVPQYFDRKFVVCTAEYALTNNVHITCGNKQCIHCQTCYKAPLPLVDTDLVCEILKQEYNKFLKNGGVIF